jgi:transcriptional regulator with XRE-family HTH domain
VTKSVFSIRYDRLTTLLVAARKKADLSQVEVAAKLRRPQSFISKYERGERRLDVVEFLDIAKALRFDPCELIRQLDH